MEINGVECVDIEGAASIIGVTSGRIRQLITESRLPFIAIGKRMKYIPLKAVQDFATKPRPVGNPTFGKKKEVLDIS